MQYMHLINSTHCSTVCVSNHKYVPAHTTIVIALILYVHVCVVRTVHVRVELTTVFILIYILHRDTGTS